DGFSFSSFNSGSRRLATPQMVVAPDGQVVMAWDDFGSLANANPPRDRIVTDQIVGGGTGLVFSNTTGGVIRDAFHPQSGNDVPAWERRAAASAWARFSMTRRPGRSTTR